MTIRTLVLVPLLGLSMIGFVNPALAESDENFDEPQQVQPQEEADQPLPEVQSEEDADQPLPDAQADEDSDQPLPEARSEEDADQPLPQVQSEEDSDQPLPDAQADEDSDQPLPEARSEEDADQPLPQVQSEEDADQPFPEDQAEEKVNRPLPKARSAEEVNRPLPKAQSNNNSGQQLQKAEDEVEEALNVFEKIMSNPDKRIPAELLAKSEGIAIIPKVFQAGLVFGGRRGTGIMMVRYPDGTWSNPAFISLTGGSVGFQVGAKSSDIVMVFPSRNMVNEVLSKDYDIGGSVTGTAGPVGVTPVDPTRNYSKNKIYTYSRNRGLFGGVTLDGSKLGLKQDRAQAFYGNDSVTTRKIFTDPFIPAPVVVNSLREALEQSEAGTFNRY
jgi:SH3 domain-containing YSC84-like protein 1